MYERFTDRARKAMQVANQEAQRLNHEYLGTEHILLGLTKDSDCLAVRMLQHSGVSIEQLRLETEKLAPAGPDMVTMGKLPPTPRAKKVIELSFEEAFGLNLNYVGTEHLLLALLREQDGNAWAALKAVLENGERMEYLRNLLRTSGSNEKQPRPPESRWTCQVGITKHSPSKVRSARIVQVLEVVSIKGAGEVGDPIREVTEYWSENGKLLATAEPTL